MAKLKMQAWDGTRRVAFKCPGCGDWHSLPVEGEGRPRWGWNGDTEKPTLTPSILVRSGHFSERHKPEDGCWCTYNAEHPDEEPVFNCYLCHSYVRDGQIQFLGDCSHALKNQTVPLPDIVEEQAHGH